MTIKKTCEICGKDVWIENIEPLDWEELRSPDRRNIQDILHYIKPKDREILISGVCGDCWHTIFVEKKVVNNEKK